MEFVGNDRKILRHFISLLVACHRPTRPPHNVHIPDEADQGSGVMSITIPG
jgi:hypothetical protein